MGGKVSMGARREITKTVAEEYQRSRKKGRSRILDQVVGIAGYNRTYAGWLLRHWGKRVVVWRGRQRLVYVGVRSRRWRRRRNRSRQYGPEVLDALRWVWKVLDRPCSRRLVDFLPEIIPHLERQGVLRLRAATRCKLLEISSRTVDRLLVEDRRKAWGYCRRGGTKPGSLVKSQIAIRTFAQWDEKRPGFLEVDSVEHNGGNSRGIYAITVNATDVATGWTEPIAVENKSQARVRTGLERMLPRFPFPVLGLDSDSGGEYINHLLLTFCQDQRITFTRSRPYAKNDQCYIEQKNWLAVRRVVGYLRHDTPRELALLNRIYSHLRLYHNFFQPQMKLVEKSRHGNRVSRRYDRAQTPYQRVLARSDIPEQAKHSLRRQYQDLNPLELLTSIRRLHRTLTTYAVSKRKRNVPMTISSLG